MSCIILHENKEYYKVNKFYSKDAFIEWFRIYDKTIVDVSWICR